MKSEGVLQKYYDWFRAIITANEDHEELLNDQLSNLSVEGRINYLNYLIREYRQGVVENLLKQRFEHEVYFEDHLFTSEELTSYSPAERAYFHLCRVHTLIENLFKSTIPSLCTELERGANQFIEVVAPSGEENKALIASSAPISMVSEPTTESLAYDGEEEILNPQQVADLLGVKVQTVYYYTSVTKELPVLKVGNRSFYRKSDVLKMYKPKSYRNPELEIEVEKQFQLMKKKRQG